MVCRLHLARAGITTLRVGPARPGPPRLKQNCCASRIWDCPAYSPRCASIRKHASAACLQCSPGRKICVLPQCRGWARNASDRRPNRFDLFTAESVFQLLIGSAYQEHSIFLKLQPAFALGEFIYLQLDCFVLAREWPARSDKRLTKQFGQQ